MATGRAELDQHADNARQRWDTLLKEAKLKAFVAATHYAQMANRNGRIEFPREDWRLMRVSEAPMHYAQYAEVGDVVLVRRGTPERVPPGYVSVFSIRFGAEVVFPEHYLAAV